MSLLHVRKEWYAVDCATILGLASVPVVQSLCWKKLTVLNPNHEFVYVL